MSQKIKILLVDDHSLVREGLVNLINQQPDLVKQRVNRRRWHSSPP
jgi:DNA-binding NarL/FixJ family response regulator